MTDRRARQNVLRWLLLGVAVAVSAMAIVKIIQFSRTPVYRDVPFDSGALDQPTPDAPQPILPTGPDDLERMLTAPGAEPTDAEPADLPPPAGAGAVNLMRYRRVAGPIVEHASIWTIRDADYADVASYYGEAAQGKGFEELDRRELAETRVRQRRYGRDGQVLTIRVRQAGASVRVVLQLRYTTAD